MVAGELNRRRASLTKISRRFGDEVARIVHGCTGSDVLPKPPWKTRQASACCSSWQRVGSILLVSAADKHHNARAILADPSGRETKTPSGESCSSYFA
jgi:GTP pyrophosphokinase